MKMKNRRKKFFVDQKLQGTLASRLVAIWLLGGALILAFPVAVNLLYGLFMSSMTTQTLMQEITQSLWFPALTALMVIPIGVRYSIRFSNRIAGPIYRIKTEINSLLDDGSFRPIKLRPNDFFFDLADDINRLADRVQHLERLVNADGHENPNGNGQPQEEAAATAPEMPVR